MRRGQLITAAGSAMAHALALLALAAVRPEATATAPQAMNVQLVSPLQRPAPVAPRPPEARPVARRPPSPERAPAASQAAVSGGGVEASAAALAPEPAPADSGPPAPPAAERPAPPSRPVDAYRHAVWRRLADHPPAARPGSGVARVRFSLNPAGQLVSVRLMRSSGRPAFDRACLAAVRAAAPFPPAPESADASDLVFEAPIRSTGES